MTTMMTRRTPLILAIICACSSAFVIHQPTTRATSLVRLFEEKRDVSRSGNKRERLNRMAELEDERLETDKGFVLKAAGGFAGLLVLLLAVAAANGIFDNVGY
jgi:hypothetical protein